MSKDLLSTIEELRTKPLHVRNRYAFFIALGFTLVIMVAWVTTLPSRLDTEVADTDSNSNEGDTSFKESFGLFANDMKEKFSSLTSELNKLGTATSTPTSTPSNVLDIEALLASSSEEALVRNELASTTEFQATSSTSSSPTAL